MLIRIVLYYLQIWKILKLHNYRVIKTLITIIDSVFNFKLSYNYYLIIITIYIYIIFNNNRVYNNNLYINNISSIISML